MYIPDSRLVKLSVASISVIKENFSRSLYSCSLRVFSSCISFSCFRAARPVSQARLAALMPMMLAPRVAKGWAATVQSHEKSQSRSKNPASVKPTPPEIVTTKIILAHFINFPTYHHSSLPAPTHSRKYYQPVAPPLWKHQKSTRRVGVAASISGGSLVENDGSVSVDLNTVFEVES